MTQHFKVGIAVGVIILLALALYFSSAGKKVSNLTSSASPVSVSDPQIEEVLRNTQKTLMTASLIKNTAPRSQDWTVDAETVIPLSGSSFYLAAAGESAGDIPLYKDFKIESLDKAVLTNLETEFDKTFIDQGFTKNVYNTFLNEEKSVHLGYEKGEIKCFINLYALTNPFAEFFCGKHNKQIDDWRKEVGGSINEMGDGRLHVEVTNMNDKFAAGYVSQRFARGAYSWIAAKQDNPEMPWKIVFEGKDRPRCSIIDQYSIPKDFYDDCTEKNGAARHSSK